MNFIVFCMSVIGLTNILLESSLFTPVRDYLKSKLSSKVYEVFECHQCMGTWVGFLIGSILLDYHLFLFYGFAGSFLASSYNRIFILAEEYVLTQTEINVDIDNND